MGAIAVNLSADEMKRAAAYFSRQTLRPSTFVGALRRGRAEGEKLFETGLPNKGVASCASCHGMRGEGLPDLFPRLAGQHQPYIARAVAPLSRRQPQQRSASHDARGRCPLSDREIDAVSNYVALLH